MVIYGLIFMCRSPPSVYSASSGTNAKGMVPLAYLSSHRMFFTAFELRRHVARLSPRGIRYTYAQRGLHEIAGFFSGWLILLDYILVPSLLLSDQRGGIGADFPRVPALGVAAGLFHSIRGQLLGIEFHGRVNRYMLIWNCDAGSVRRAGIDCPVRRRGRRRLTLQPIYDPRCFRGRRGRRHIGLRCFSFLGLTVFRRSRREPRKRERLAERRCCL